MLDVLKLRVVTPSGRVLDQLATSVVASSEVGEFCVLPEHAPVLAALKPGRLMVEADGETLVFATDVGFFECGADHVNVMTAHCVSKAAIADQLGTLEGELASLQATLAELEDDNPQEMSIQLMLAWVEAQISVAKE